MVFFLLVSSLYCGTDKLHWNFPKSVDKLPHLDNQSGNVTRVGFFRVVSRQFDSQGLFDPRGAFVWREIGAHAKSLKLEIVSGSSNEPNHPLPSPH
jgi:hypothetical protein